MLTIVVWEKGGSVRRIPFEGSEVRVGREEDNQLVLDRPNVSKHHLLFRRGELENQVEVEDLDSTNGTYVNGRRLQQSKLISARDRIYVGDYVLVLEGEALSTATLEDARGSHGAKTAVTEYVPKEGSPSRTAPPLMETTSSTVPYGSPPPIVTSARRVMTEVSGSAYLDEIVDRVIKTMLLQQRELDPVVRVEIEPERREETMQSIEAALADLQDAGELDVSIAIEPLRDRVAQELLAIGPLSELMARTDMREIQIVGGAPIRIIREADGGRMISELTEIRFSGDRGLMIAVMRLAKRWNLYSEPATCLEGRISDGFVMYALVPGTGVECPVLCLRRMQTDATTLAALVQEGVLNHGMREFLTLSLQARRRIVVSGSGGVDLDRFLRAMLAEIPDEMRVACVSDTGRLGASRSGWARLRRIGNHGQTMAVSEALTVLMRGGVDFVVGQGCRLEDAEGMVDALCGAASGTLVSIWAIDAEHALARLAGLASGSGVADVGLTEALARSVDFVVRLHMDETDDSMKIFEIVEPKTTPDGVSYVPIFRYQSKPGETGKFGATGVVPRFCQQNREMSTAVQAIPHELFRAQ